MRVVPDANVLMALAVICFCLKVKAVFNMTAREGRRRTISCLVAVGNGNGAAGLTQKP